MINVWRRMAAAAARKQRLSGEPRSANGASSLHLLWDVPTMPLREVSCTLEILEPPQVRRLYFWALQVTFAAGATLRGGAHLGLQWNPRHPGSTAVNWGGYAPEGDLLRGSPSGLVSTPRDPNTRDYPWQVGTPYRLRIASSPDQPPSGHAWRGTVTDLTTGTETVVRDLHASGPHLAVPMVWSEVFARCEQPSAAVRWSDLRARDASGKEIVPERVRVNYQARRDGGCDNTSVSIDELGVIQATAVARQVPQGTLIPVGRRP